MDEECDHEDLNKSNDRTYDSSFLEKKGVDQVKKEIINADKDGVKWLIIDDIYICHKYQSTANENFWECAGRRKLNCPFKAGTLVDPDGQEKLIFMYKLSCHDCGQNKEGVLLQKFRNVLKNINNSLF